MKKSKFSTKYTDKNDGETVKLKVVVDVSDLRKDLGSKFIFIETTHYDGDRKIYQEVSVPFKSAKKLIKSLQKVTK
jgi:hypothetical protein